jgi:hypothetical protein
MYRNTEFRGTRLFMVVVLMLLGLVLSPAQNLYAQGAEPAVGPTDATAAEDDASWQSTDAATSKADAMGPLEADDVDKTQQFDSNVYLPGVQVAPQVGTAATDAFWHTMMFEGFEGIWPAGCWSVRDNNGVYDGSHLWDDTNTGHYSGSWSAHPNDGAIYRNIMDTHMRCGPINLQHAGAGVTAARLRFVYWLDTEAAYDFFHWEYSCNGVTNWVGGQERSGRPGTWLSVNHSLNSCIGYTNVYIRFNFRSDDSVTDNGVWVDNIYVEKFY